MKNLSTFALLFILSLSLFSCEDDPMDEIYKEIEKDMEENLYPVEPVVIPETDTTTDGKDGLLKPCEETFEFSIDTLLKYQVYRRYDFIHYDTLIMSGLKFLDENTMLMTSGYYVECTGEYTESGIPAEIGFRMVGNSLEIYSEDEDKYYPYFTVTCLNRSVMTIKTTSPEPLDYYNVEEVDKYGVSFCDLIK